MKKGLLKGCIGIVVCVCCGYIGFSAIVSHRIWSGSPWEKLPSPPQKISEILKINITVEDQIRSEALVRTEAGERYMCRSGHPSCVQSEVSEKQARGDECYSRPAQQELSDPPPGKMIDSCYIVDIDGNITIILQEDNSLWLKEIWLGMDPRSTIIFSGILGGIIGLIVGLVGVFVAWVIRKIGKARQAAP